MKDENNAVDFQRIFEIMGEKGASDLHLKVNAPPLFRVDGCLGELAVEPLKEAQIQALLSRLLPTESRERLRTSGDIDFSCYMPTLGRLRVNAYYERGCLSIACRRVQNEIPSFEELRLPADALRKIASCREGLVLAAGPNGSGKSTTLAALVDHINQTRPCHIVTVEDPIEFLFTHKKAYFSQREVGIDVSSFERALKSVVRQDPEVILIGEMRDRETFATALVAAETGHLVLSSIHASGAPQAIGRILDLFPVDERESIRRALAFHLRAVLCQKLLPSTLPDKRRVPALEILVTNSTVQMLIREARDRDLPGALRLGREDGMMDFNQSILELLRGGLITRRVAFAISPQPEQLKMALQGIRLSDENRILAASCHGG